MKKISLLLVSLLTISTLTMAQAYEENIQYDKKKQPAIVIEYAYPSQAVENAFVQRMEKLGYKAKEEKGILNRDKGFLIFKNAYVTDISKEKIDYIIKVERKSRKASDEAVLYLIMQKDGTNAMDKMESYDIGQAKSYLNTMLPDIEAAHLELQIKAQEEVVVKAEKKLKGLQDDKIELERKLTENAKAQDDTIKDIETQKTSLETLQGRRKRN
ncbi:MAG TPA: hypothetical protein VGO58_03845 [Chitinophagaceae bacterium]|jgi:hypothetical protein|nr:hypothetical protein [Chitinophagaceae bacterium]